MSISHESVTNYKIYYLTQAQYDTLITTGSITVDGQTIQYDPTAEYRTPDLRGVPGGVAELDANGKVPVAQCPIEEDVAQATTDWLDEHITQETGYVIDDSLTISGAAADAKKAGDEINSVKSTVNAITIINSASGTIASFDDGADGLPLKSLTVNIEPVQSGNGDPSPNNVRPISGWTGYNIIQGQIPTNLTWTQTKAINKSGVIIDSNDAAYSGFIPVQIGNNLLAFNSTAAQKRVVRIHGYTADGQWNSQIAVQEFLSDDLIGLKLISFNVPNGITQIRLSTGNIASFELLDVGKHIPITFPSPDPGTVYGGTLDVTNGVLIVDHIMLTKNTSTMNNTQNYPGWKNAGVSICVPSGFNDVVPDSICNILPSTTIYINMVSGAHHDTLFFAGSGYTQTQLKALAIDCQFVLPLLSPISYQLTPTEITTLLGTNNIWADCGDVTVEYPVDTQSTINKQAADLKNAVNNFDSYIQQIPSASYSGSSVTINSNDVPIINEAILNCYPLQAAGVSTPDNPIPIYDYENIVLTQVHNGTQKQYTFPIFDLDGNPTSDAWWLTGGTLNTKTGEYRSTYYKKTSLNSVSWTLRKTIGDYHLFDWRSSTPQTQGYPDIHNCSNVFQYVDYDQTNYYNSISAENVDKTFSVNTNGRIYIWSTASTVADFQAWLNTIGAYVVYRRNTAVVGSTTPTEIEVYDGDNTFILENGTVQLNYKSFANYTNIMDFKKYNFRMNFDTVKTIAHRGDGTVAPQCTAPAYIAAKKNGAKYAENDLNVSSDGAYVMWHDTTLSRLGTYLKDINGYDMYTDGTLYYWYDSMNDKLYTWDGSNYQESAVQISTLIQCAGTNYSVTALPLMILKRIDFGAYKGAAFKGTQILTFAEWVLLCKQLGLQCYVDQKVGFTDSVASDIVGIARNLGMLNKMSWIATGRSSTIRTYDPKARVLITFNPTTALIEQYSPLLSGGPVVFSGDATSLTEEAVHLALTAGFEVEGYYADVNTSEDSQLAFIKTLVGYGVTGLTLEHYFVSDAFENMILN